MSHLAVFSVSYLVIRDLDHGWLAVNIWHNAQYILLVWMYNNNRFRNGIDPAHRFLSTISQQRNALIYFAVCLISSTALYFGIDQLLRVVAPQAGMSLGGLVLIVYSAINFHHYIVDGVIWKVRRKPLQKNLGVTA